MGWYEQEERVGREGEEERQNSNGDDVDDTRDEHVLLKFPVSLAAARKIRNTVKGLKIPAMESLQRVKLLVFK